MQEISQTLCTCKNLKQMCFAHKQSLHLMVLGEKRADRVFWSRRVSAKLIDK